MIDEKNTDIINTVLDKVSAAMDEYSMLPRGAEVAVALSGGADSVCLLDALLRLSKTKKFTVCAAHLNHMIRGEEAERDMKFCGDLCEKLGVALYTEKRDVPKLAEENGLTDEEAGRRARYDFFARLMSERDIKAAATAHNKNDRAETVLMRIIRGTGLSGLRGIRYKRGDSVIRPLLDVTRSEIEEYCEAAGLEYITDSTNSDARYTRNNIRLNLLPLIEKEFNPSVVNALCNLADSAAEDADFMEGYAERLYARLRPPLTNSGIKALHIESLRTVAQKSIVSRLIMLCAKDAMGEDYKPERKHIEAVHKIIDGESSGTELPGGLRVSERYGWLEFWASDKDKNNAESLNSCNNIEFCVEVGADKLYNIEKTGAEISITLIGKDALGAMKGDILLDADKLGLDDESIKTARFKLRSRIAGDRIAVYKNGKTKKLKSLFIDRKIRREDRAAVPVLCFGDEIIAVLGVRVSEIYKPDKHTKNYLVVHYEE